MKKCIVLVMLSVLIISSSVVTAFAAYSTMSRSIDVDLVKMKALQLYYGRFDANWLLVVNPKTTTLSDSWVVDIGMENLNDLIYEANSCGVTTQKYEYKDGWYCAIVSGGYFVKDGVVVGGSPYYTWGNVNGYAYIAKEEQYNINVPSVDMSNTNSILASIYNAFYSYSYAQNETLYALYNKFAAYSSAQNGLLASVAGELTSIGDYLVSVLNDYFYPLVYNIDANIDSMELMLSGIGTTLDQMYRRLLVINNDIELNTDAMSTTLTEIKTLLETGIPVTGVDIGDVTVSTDLTNVEGYIDTVETKLQAINTTINNQLRTPSGQPFGIVVVSSLNTVSNSLSNILAELQNDTSTDVATDLTNVEGYIDQLESKLDSVNSNLRIGQFPALVTINSGIVTTNNRLNDIYTRLEGIEDAVLDAENTVIDITTDNDAFNIFYVEKTDGTSESVGETATDAAKVVGEFLSVFYRLIFADGLENADIIHDFEEVYTVTDSGVSVW